MVKKKSIKAKTKKTSKRTTSVKKAAVTRTSLKPRSKVRVLSSKNVQKKNVATKRKVVQSKPQGTIPGNKVIKPPVTGEVSPVGDEPTKSQEPSLDSSVNVAGNMPSRPPMRKIIGGKGGPIVVLKDKPALEVVLEETKPTSEVSTLQSNRSLVEKFLDASWDLLDTSPSDFANIPPYLVILTKATKRACNDAAQWPFAFARMIAELPKTIGVYEFLITTLSSDFGVAHLSKLLRLSSEQIEIIHEVTCEKLQERFSEVCSELCRKWQLIVQGNGSDVRHLIERYLVDGIDPAVQELIGKLLLESLRGKNGKTAQLQDSQQDSLSVVGFSAALVSEATN